MPQWCCMTSFLVKYFCTSQPNDAMWNHSFSNIFVCHKPMMPYGIFHLKKIAIQQQPLHTRFFANKEKCSSKSTIQALWQKQVLEKTNYQERSQRISVSLTSSRQIFLWIERLKLEQHEINQLSYRENLNSEFNDAIWHNWERKG